MPDLRNSKNRSLIYVTVKTDAWFT